MLVQAVEVTEPSLRLMSSTMEPEPEPSARDRFGAINTAHDTCRSDRRGDEEIVGVSNWVSKPES